MFNIRKAEVYFIKKPELEYVRTPYTPNGRLTATSCKVYMGTAFDFDKYEEAFEQATSINGSRLNDLKIGRFTLKGWYIQEWNPKTCAATINYESFVIDPQKKNEAWKTDFMLKHFSRAYM